MRRAARHISALGAVFFALAGLSACGGSSGVPGNAVAQVAGTAIPTSAFDHWVDVAVVSGQSGVIGQKPTIPVPPKFTACVAHFKEVDLKEIATNPAAKKNKPLTEAQLKKQCEQQYKTYVQEVVGFLTSSQWVLAEANALGVSVSDEEVHKQFLKIKNAQFPSAAEFQKFLKTSGQTVSDLLLRVKLNLLSTKIQQKITKEKGTVTTADIEKYYHQNASRYGTPERRNVLTILTKTEAAAKKAKEEVVAGKSWASVAKKYSVDTTTKNTGGLLQGLTKGTQAPLLDAAEFAAPLETLEGPVKTSFGYTIFKVVKITPGSTEPLSKVRSQIKSQLAASKQQESLTKFVKEFKKRWKSKTECKTGFVVANCKEYKAPKGAAAAAEGAEG